MTEKLQLRDAVYRLEDTIREIRNRFADDQGRVDEIAFEEGKADTARIGSAVGRTDRRESTAARGSSAGHRDHKSVRC